MAVPHSLEDTMRRHDVAVYNWLGGLHLDYGNFADLHEIATIDRNDFPILRVFATPQRALAKVIDTLTHTGWIAGADAAVQLENAAELRARAEKNFAVLPLPLATITRQDPVPNLLDAGAPKLFRKQCFDLTSGEWQTQPWPGAYETTYEITFWSIKRYSSVFFREWIYSQLGCPGRADNETLIPVVHNYPWGTLDQRLVFESSNDESELEGEDPAYKRFSFSFRLRTWHFRDPKPVDGVDSPGAADGKVGYVHDVSISECLLLPHTGAGTEWSSEDLPIPSPGIKPLSLNMFSFFLADNLIPKQWPKTGNATVKRGSISRNGMKPHETLRMSGIQAATDEVLLVNRPVPLDPLDGRAVMLFQAYYKGTEDAELVLASRDPGVEPIVWINNQITALPEAYPWTRIEWLALVSQPILSLTARGVGTVDPGVLNVTDIRLHHVRTIGKVAPDSSIPGGGQTVHSFTVPAVGHIAVVAFDTGAVADTINVNGDNYAVDPANEIGLVAVFTEPGGTATVTVPDTIPTLEVYVQPYLGFWEGSEV